LEEQNFSFKQEICHLKLIYEKNMQILKDSQREGQKDIQNIAQIQKSNQELILKEQLIQ
jgi:hypothetical protein